MRIALIAMSGIRACDPELLRLGLTLPGFVERSKAIASLPSLGLLTLAGLTPVRHTCHYLEVEDIRKLRSLPLEFDLVAISSFSAQIAEAYELADRYRERGIPVVLGGLHVSAVPEEAKSHADAIAVGEGEPTWLDVLNDAETGRLKSLYECPDSRFDLADAPMPSFELLDISQYNRLTVQTSRGCPWRCEFCAGSVLLTGRYKQKPIAKVLAEIDRICALWPRPFIEFADDNSFVNKNYWKKLLEQLKSRRIRWFTETDLSVHQDDDLLNLMRESGCVEVLIGIESPEAASMRGLELKTDWKSKHWPESREAIQRIQSHGIRVNGCFILGLDGQGPDIFDRVYEFARETELYDVQITIQTPFPGTPLYRRLQDERRILRERAWETCTLFDVNYEPKGMSADELRRGLRDLGVRLYSVELTEWRRTNFRRKYLRGVRRYQEV